MRIVLLLEIGRNGGRIERWKVKNVVIEERGAARNVRDGVGGRGASSENSVPCLMESELDRLGG